MTVIEATAGESVYDVLNRGLTEAKKTGKMVSVGHNNIHVTVRPQSYIHDLCTIYDLRKIIKSSIKNSI